MTEAEQERAAVVAWLLFHFEAAKEERKAHRWQWRKNIMRSWMAASFKAAAISIERGEHRKDRR